MNRPLNEILVGDARQVLQTLPPGSVDTVVTSPAYYRLRDYQVDGQLGLEPSVSEWVDQLVAVCDEIARVLQPTGSLWLNLGDSYSRHDRFGAPPKGLLLGPERLVLALSDRGWMVRNKVVWAKPNPMPTSVRDRLNTTWEPLFLLVRSPRYFFDLDAIREPHGSQRQAIHSSPTGLKYGGGQRPPWAGPLAGSNDGLMKARAEGRSGHVLGKNPGDFWVIPTAGYRGAHFATFPPALIERPLLATCPERVCVACGLPWQRESTSEVVGVRRAAPRDDYVMRLAGTWGTLHRRGESKPTCPCGADWRPGVVLDPFMGSGTTAIVAERLGRDWLGIELKPEYVELATERIDAERAKREVMSKNNNERSTAA